MATCRAVQTRQLMHNLTGVGAVLEVGIQIPVEHAFEQPRQSCRGAQVPGLIVPSSLQHRKSHTLFGGLLINRLVRNNNTPLVTASQRKTNLQHKDLLRTISRQSVGQDAARCPSSNQDIVIFA